MTPDERQMLSDLFERIRGTSNAPRDPQAESFINDAIRAAPYAPYVMSQTVIVQQHALEQAQQRIQELEAQARNAPPPQQETSFLGRLFGASPSAPRAPSQYDASSYQRGSSNAPPPPPPPNYGGGSPGYAPQPQGYAPQAGPWGAPSGGGFLHGAVQTATGVAGGMLLANAVEGLFSGGRGYGGGGGGLFGGFGGGGGPSEVVNNYYNDAPQGGGDQHAADVLQDMDQDQDDAQDAQDNSNWDDGSSGGGYDT